MMKRPEFLETKRTPRYSLRKLNVGVASVLLGVTIFGINFTDHSVKAATIENVKASNSSPTSNLQVGLRTTGQTNPQKATGATEKVQQTSASNTATANNSIESATTLQSAPKTQGSADTDIKSSAATVDQNNTNTQQATSAKEKVQQNSASKNATANNSTEAATTSQSAPKTQSSADTDIRSLDIRSLTAISAAKLATMNLMQTNGINGTDTDGNAAAKLSTMNLLAMNLMKASGTGTGTGTDTGTYKDRSAAATVDPNNINNQPAKENQKLANDNNLTSSDNYSSNIYKGKDGKYYKVVTIYGNDYVYHAADIQANGTAFGQYATSAEDTKNNINISKEDLGNGKTRWTVVFFPHKGLQNVGSNLSGLQSAKFGIALTNDYQIVGDVDMDITTDPKQTFVAHTFKDNSNRATDITVSNPSPEVKFSFNPNTDVDPNTGLINSKTMPAYNNQYLQGPYYFNTDAYAGRRNLWQTYFEDGVEYNNAYDKRIPYLGGNHDFHLNNFEIKNKTGVDGAKQKDKIIYDTLGYRLNSKNANPNGVFSSDNFNQAMEFKSQGVTDQSQFSSYKISFTTQHTDSHEVELTTGPKNQQFSGIAANIYSFQNKYYNMFSSLYGEQRALNPADAAHPDAPLKPLNPKDIIPNWQIGEDALAKINKDYLNNAQINALSSEIYNNAADPDALAKIVDQGNALNDAMKKLGNSIGQYDPDGRFAKYKEDTTKGSDRYKYANPDKKAAYDNATEVTKALINKDTGTYADQATVEKLTNEENTAWSALDGVKPDAEKITPKVPKTKEPVADPSHLTQPEKDKVKKNVEDANKDKFPGGTTVTVGDDGTATITYPDQTKSTDTIPGDQLVQGQKGGSTSGQTDAEKITPNVPAKEPVADPSHLTQPEKDKVKKNVEDANKDKFPGGTTVTVGDDGTATITYPDQTKSTDTIPGSDLVRPETDAEKITPNVPAKEPVADPSHLTQPEKDKVKKNVEDANKDKFPGGTTVTVGDDGTATITYPDQTKSTDTIPGDQLVQGQKGGSTSGQTDAEKITPNVPAKEPVADPSHLTQPEKDKVKKNVEDANKDKFPGGTTVTVGDDGTATITYPDQTKSTDTIPGDQLVQGQKGGSTSGQTDAEKITPNVPAKEPVADPSHLTQPEKDKVKKNVEDANKDKFPGGTTVTVGDDGTATITYPDQTKSTDTIPGSDLVRPETDAEKITPNVPAKEPVADPSHLTQPEKDKVKKNVEDANKDKFPGGTTVTVGDDGTATITYPDQTKSTDTIPGSDLVRPETDAEKITPNVPAKEPVADPSHLTQPEKDKVKKNVEDANKDKFPGGTTVTVGDDGTATITYPDQTKSTDTIPGSDLVRPETDAEKITPNVPAKEPVADPSHLTQPEKDKVKKNVEDANKDKFPGGTTVTVGDDGTATITYPDQTKSTDTIPGDQLVQGQKGGSTSGQTDAEKITPNVPAKEPVADPSHLTQPEKDKVKKNVEDANKDKFPGGTTVTVGDDGTATITYPDQTKSTDTIPGDQLVQGQKGGSTSGQTDAEKITPNVPAKEPVADPSHLTQPEKDKVKKNVEDANKDKFPGGTTVTVGDDGTATITYPDQTKSTDTIPGSDLVRPETDAEKITPNVPAKEPVADPSHLTQPEKDKVKKNVEDANKDKFPGGTTVTVGDDGTATITYPDQTKSTDTIPGDQLVQGQKGGSTSGQTDAEKITPNVPAKEPVADPSHLTQPEKDKVKKNVEDANKDKFPGGTTVTVGDDGTATITYPDQTKSTDTIPGDQLVQGQKGGSTSGQTDAEKITPNVPAKEPVADPSHLTQPEKDKVKKNVEDANKDKFPGGTTVTVGDDGTATITYPDQTKSTDTIPGSDLVRPETDAEKITPNVPAKEPVADPSHLTQPEKDKVKKNVEDANKDKFPGGTTVTVGDDGTATITYPDQTKSTDTIPGSDLVRPETDAEKITPNVPAKEPVADPSHLTQPEKDKVKKNVEDANKDKFPGGTTVTVGDDGTATITYPDQTKSTDTIPGDQLVQGQKGGSTSGQTDAEKITPNVPAKEPVADPSHLTQPEKDKVKKNVEDANKDKFPGGTTVTVGDDGTATITYPDQTKSTDTIPGSDLVRPETDAEKITPNVPAKEPVADPSHLTQPEKDKVKKNVEDANKDKFPGGTTVTVGDDGTATITYPDQTKSTDTIPGSDLVRPETDAEKITPNVPAKEPVADPSHLTQPEKDKVKKNVEDANKDKFPGGTTVTVGDDGTATITYPDQTKSTDTIPGSDLVRPETDAEKITPNVPAKEPVADPSHLTQPEKDKVKKNVEDANKDKFPGGTTVTVGDDGTATITYPDQTKSTDTIPGDQLVQGQKGGSTSGQTDAEKITPNVPAKEPVADPSHLTQPEKDKVKKNVEDANKDKFPGGTTVTVGDDGTATITYPDQTKSTDTIPGSDLVRPETDAEKITPNVPAKEPVADPSHLTQPEKDKVKKNVEDANKDKFPGGTTVTVGDDGTATITYPDQTKSTDTIPGSDLVRPETDAEKITPNVPAKEPVADPSHLTQPEKDKVKKNVEDANKDKFPGGTTVTVGDDGTATITYPDQTKSTDTIPGDQLVQGQKGGSTSGQTDAEKITPNVPAKEPVADPSHLTQPEKDKVKKNVEDANKDENGKSTLPEGTTVTVGSDGTATVTYPDHSKDTIPGDQLVQGQKGDTTDAGNITPTVPGDKVTVKDPSHLTDDEKKQVKNNVDNANKDKFPAGTTVEVGKDGTATVTYPDGSKDTIPGDQLVQGQKGSTTDAGNITPTIPGGKVTVKDPSHLTDDEKNQVKNNVDNANKDKFPAGTTVEVGKDGTATVTYPDGSKDTIPGDQLVQGQKGGTTDAGNITPTVPGGKVTVKDPSHLTDDEKNQVKNNVDNANKDKFPAGTTVEVGKDGTATVTYPDGSKDTIPGDQLVQGQKGDTTDAGNITPTIPGGKVTVKDPSHLTDDEKNQVKNNVDNANKDKFPAGTDVKVGDDGTTTVTYPDGSQDTIPGDQLVQGQKGDTTDAGKITPNVPGDKVTVKDPSHLTDTEKDQVKTNVTNDNKDNLPSGSQVTVGDDGTTTVTYPDGSKDTIPGSDLVRQATDADKTTPSVPETKVPVTDPSHLTDTEKDQVKTNVTNDNKDNLPSGSQVTVGDDGTTTVTYPDGSKDTIPGSDLVRQSTDADKITPSVPETKVPVTDPSHLTDTEKDQVKTNVTNDNKDNLPSGSQVTVDNDGTTTVTYPDDSKDTIPGSDLVRQSTDADKTTPSVPETKVPVTDPSHLTDSERDQVKTNVTNDNKDNLPSGSQITVGDDGTATITYPDGSKDTISGRDLIKGISGNKHDSNSSSGSNGTISNTDDETSGDTVNNAESMNGNTAKSGSKNNSLKTLPQTGTKDVTILEILGLFLSLFGLLGLKKKHHEE
ncbi:LEA family epithelial adhesin [Limosilactobacillus reuteri]